MKVMRLRSQETVSGRKEYIVLGATSVAGEDIQCKGKVGVVMWVWSVDVVYTESLPMSLYRS